MNEAEALTVAHFNVSATIVLGTRPYMAFIFSEYGRAQSVENGGDILGERGKARL